MNYTKPEIVLGESGLTAIQGVGAKGMFSYLDQIPGPYYDVIDNHSVSAYEADE